MSLSSSELNYLVWRYLQESGFELAAYALDKHSGCSASVDRPDNDEFTKKIFPGALVDLVQKGILYSVTDEEITREPALSTLYGSVLASQGLGSAPSTSSQSLQLRSEMMDVDDANGTAEPESEPKPEPETNGTVSTAKLAPVLEFDPSIALDWHPSLAVYAYGLEHARAVIAVLNDAKDAVAETVTLAHPAGTGSNDINLVSWIPSGTLLVTAGLNGELRAWSPDGKLKNVMPVGPQGSSVAVVSLTWSETGHYLLSVDSANQVSLWDANLTLIKQINANPGAAMSPTGSTSSALAGSSTHNSLSGPSGPPEDFTAAVCWLSEHKFGITTPKHQIKIYNIAGGDVAPIGSLPGHAYPISILTMDPKSKLLASVSDYDYQLKIWAAGASQEFLALNTGVGHTRHAGPVVSMSWRPRGDARDPADASALVSVSMDGVVNVWDTASGAASLSQQLFPSEKGKAPPLVFNAVMAPNHRWLAVADDYARVSVFDVGHALDSGTSVAMVAQYEVALDKDEVGVCDLKWDAESRRVGASYKGHASVVLEVNVS
ncbi:SIR4-interacting protein Sif2p [Diutina catenulata]